MIQTSEPIPTYILLDPVRLFCTWHFRHGVYGTNCPFPRLIIICGGVLQVVENGWVEIYHKDLSVGGQMKTFLHMNKFYCCVSR